MELSSFLLKEFAKITNDTSESPSKDASQVYGTIVIQGGNTYVKLDGSELLTPVSLAMNARHGHRVIVSVKNHTATIVGNISYPADNVQSGITIPGDVIDGATLNNIPYAAVDDAFITDLTAQEVFTTTLKATSAELGYVTADEIDAKLGDFGYLKSDELEAEIADLGYVTADEIDAKMGDFGYLKSDELEAEVAELGYLTADFANIDFASIKTENVSLLLAETGLVDRATIVEGHVTKLLDTVELNANSITVGTLKAERILLNGDEGGVLYALNNLGELESTNIDTLDGYVLTNNTITADKIVAKSITSNEIDVEDLFAQEIVASGSITGATLYGAEVYSAYGQIGGFTIDKDILISSSETDGVLKSLYLNTSASRSPFNDYGKAPVGIEIFNLDSEGNASGWYVDYDGYMFAEKGRIGGFEISENTLDASYVTVDGSATDGVYFKINSPIDDTTPFISIYRLYEKMTGGVPSSVYTDYFSVTSDGTTKSMNLEVAGNATASKFIGRLDGYLKSSDSRLSNLNVEATGTGGLYRYTSTGTDSTSKPARNAHILHCAWDTAAGLQDSQLAVLTGDTTAGLQVRGRNTSTGVYGGWYTFLHSGNYLTYSKWKTLSSAKTTVSISSLNANNCSELYVVAQVSGNEGRYTTVIPYVSLSSTQQQFLEGYYNGSYSGTCIFYATNSYVTVNNFRVGNTNYAQSDVTVTVYYR